VNVKNKEAGSGVEVPNRPKRKNKPNDPHFTPVQFYRPHRRGPWPDRPLRRFTGWPAGLRTFLGEAV
jgi:hypothetical protein